MKAVTVCRVCGCDDIKEIIQLKDHSITKEDFSLVECGCCGLIHTSPMPESEELGKYYQSEDYISHSDTKKGFISTLYHWARSYTLTKKYSWMHKYGKGNTLLDIGCGTGYFPAYMQKAGFKVAAMEPDSGARNLAEKQLNQKVYSSLEEVSGNYSHITMWHVLEHVPDLNATFQQLYQLLAKEGRLFIAIPNPASYDAQKYKEYWAAYDVPRHLYHMTPKVLSYVARRNSFELVHSINQPMDSYYISLLSEKYKKGNMIAAFWNGFVSNIKGNNQNTSSMLYILKKKND
jgi:ubiquinone/menaquinone biosynthesis C-methylase UbiE